MWAFCRHGLLLPALALEEAAAATEEAARCCPRWVARRNIFAMEVRLWCNQFMQSNHLGRQPCDFEIASRSCIESCRSIISSRRDQGLRFGPSVARSEIRKKTQKLLSAKKRRRFTPLGAVNLQSAQATRHRHCCAGVPTTGSAGSCSELEQPLIIHRCHWSWLRRFPREETANLPAAKTST